MGPRATFGRMNVHDNILGTIGNTPMIRLNNVTADFPAPCGPRWNTSIPVTASKTGWRCP